MTEYEHIESYLDALQPRLSGSPRQVRRMLWETETHLYDAVETGMAAGLSQAEAEWAALERFGGADQVAAAHQAASRLTIVDLTRRLIAQFMPAVAVGLLAIGVSGLIARVMVSVWGRAYVFADAAGTRYSPADCQHWMSLHPQAGTCTQAYLMESVADGLSARYAAGVLGLLLAAALVVAWRRGSTWVAPPSALVSFASALVFLAGGVALVAAGLDQLDVAADHGSGQWISGAILALPIGLAYLWRFIRLARDGGSAGDLSAPDRALAR